MNPYAEAQARCDAVAQAFGDFAPRPLQGENLNQYRQRLLKPFQRHSAPWQQVDLSPLTGNALDAVEAQVFADALKEARHPTHVAPGQLVERIETDETGRRIRKFFGDPEACWAPFKYPSRLVAGWGPK